jgi:hypothetical protein
MKRELVTREELEAAARRQGLEGLHEVQTCRLAQKDAAWDEIVGEHLMRLVDSMVATKQAKRR